MVETRLGAPRVSAIVLTWNSGADIVECLDHLAASDYPVLDVIVVDNGSTDGTPQRVRELFPHLTLLQNQHNLGFAEGNNVGMRYALARNTDFVFLLNDDAFVEPSTVSQLIETAESDARIGIVGPALVSYHDPTLVYYGAQLDLDRIHPQEQLVVTPRRDVFDSPYVAGCALMVKADVARKVGLLDPAYFAYWEDTDWCVRVRQAGYRVVVHPNAQVRHKGTLDQTAQKHPLASYLYRRNQFRFARKFKPFPAWLIFTCQYALDALSELENALAQQQRRAKTDAILDGWWAGITGHSGADFAKSPAWFKTFVYPRVSTLRIVLDPIHALRARFPVRTTVRRWLRKADSARL